MDQLFSEIIQLLKELISTPSPSGNEEQAADLIWQFLHVKGLRTNHKANNIWVKSDRFNKKLPTILLNSHIDTVKPSQSWTIGPYNPEEKDGKIYGLGSNDAGGALVSLLATFLLLNDEPREYNLIFAATAEEEIMGINGISSIIDHLGNVDLAIIGEPTGMQMAVAEKGLMVLDCEAIGKSGHAAREEGINPILIALEDIQKIQDFSFPKVSSLLGQVKTTVTQINAGYQHNIIPDKCSFVMDVRTNEHYTNQEVFEIIQALFKSDVKARSFRINSTSISLEHPVVKRGKEIGLTCYGSPTTSDRAVIPFTSIKIGPGDSARSHTADEFIVVDEIKKGIETYNLLLKGLVLI